MTKRPEFQQLHPTPARGKFEESQLKDKLWIAEEKLDGDRRIGQFVFLDDRPVVRFTGRRVSDVDGLMVEKTDRVPHLSGYPRDGLVTIGAKMISIPRAAVPESLIGTVLDGEFMVKNGRSKDVTSVLGSLPDRAVQVQATAAGWVEWYVFDCLFYKGLDVRSHHLAARKKMLEAVLAEWGNPYVINVPVHRHHRKETLFGEIVKKGGEGVILKHLGSKYSEEKYWVKMKKELTEDVVIMGYDEPEAESLKVSGKVSATKFHQKGWIGAVRFGQYKELDTTDPEQMKIWGKAPKLAPFFVEDARTKKKYVLVYCGSCSGMTDEVREWISSHKSESVGRVVEILANEREPTGRFRHPRWLGFRENKGPLQCLWTA